MLRTVCIFALFAALLSADETAYNLYKSGRELEKAGEFTKAFVFYSQAAALDPRLGARLARAAIRPLRALVAGMFP